MTLTLEDILRVKEIAQKSRTYYHGGAPDLTEILPPDSTGASSAAQFGARAVCRTDKVYITTDLQAAYAFASLHPSHRGTVYVVEPYGIIEHDPDCRMDGLAFQCDGAKILAKKQVDFFIMQSIRSAIMEDENKKVFHNNVSRFGRGRKR